MLAVRVSAVRGGGDGGKVSGEKPARPVTTVQDCVSVFVSVTPLASFLVCADKNSGFSTPSGNIFSHFYSQT